MIEEKHKNNPNIVFNVTELAKVLGVSKQTVCNLKKNGHLPKKKKFCAADPQVAQVIRMYTEGVDIKGRGLTTGRPLGRKTSTRSEEKLKEEVEKVLQATDSDTSHRLIQDDEEIDLESMSGQLVLRLNECTSDFNRKTIMQTLVNVEQYKKLQIETSKKRGDVVDKEQARYFFNKYFNSLNESLIEMPSVDLAEKLLGEIKMMEKRKPTKQVLTSMVKQLKGKKANEQQIIENACDELNPKVDETEIKIKIQEILQIAISNKIKATHEAIKKLELFASGK